MFEGDGQLNSKERTLATLRGQEPDRVPVYVTVVSEMAEELSQVTGIPPNNCDAYLTNRISHAEILTALGNDLVGIGSTAPPCCPTKSRSDGFRVDEWGFVYRPVPHAFGIYYEIVERPLKGIASAKELTHYRVPDPYTCGRFDVAQEHCERYGQDHALLGVIECTVFEMAWNLVGLEQFLTDMALRKQFLTDMALRRDYIEPLLDEVTNYSIGIGLELIGLGADIMLTGDDIGMDPGPMMSLNMWRKYLKPRLKCVFDAYKAAKPDIILAYHTCGSVLPFIDELIEMGMGVLNPIQVTAHGMDPAILKKKYGHQLAFCGGVDQRHVLPKGTPEDVEAEVRGRILEMGQGGGYILAPTHDVQADTSVENVLALFNAAKRCVQADTSVENVLALFNAAKRWGVYPLAH
jgi:uroporphyrinogen decarboxylase